MQRIQWCSRRRSQFEDISVTPQRKATWLSGHPSRLWRPPIDGPRGLACCPHCVLVGAETLGSCARRRWWGSSALPARAPFPSWLVTRPPERDARAPTQQPTDPGAVSASGC